MTIRMTMALCAALLFACAPETDRDHYEVGESGLVHFENTTLATLYLGGCNHFDYEKQIGDEWVSQGPDVVCVWEGFAEAVLPGAVVAEPIQARAPGTWRLRYPVGIDCAVATPLSTQHCRAVGDVTSNPFEVVESGCVVSGCSARANSAPRSRWQVPANGFRSTRATRARVAGVSGPRDRARGSRRRSSRRVSRRTARRACAEVALSPPRVPGRRHLLDLGARRWSCDRVRVRTPTSR